MSLPAAIRHAFRPSPSTDFSHPLKHAKHISLHHHLDFSQRDALQRIFKEDTLDFAIAEVDIPPADLPAFYASIRTRLDMILAFTQLGKCDDKAPYFLLDDIFAVLTVHGCESVFEFLELRFHELNLPLPLAQEKTTGLQLLRACNVLLSRLSKSQDALFCGRILSFMSSAFGLGARSGVNLRGDFNLKNQTDFEQLEKDKRGGKEDVIMVDDEKSGGEDKQDEGEVVEELEEGETNEEDSVLANENTSSALEESFYTSFWSIQPYFTNPSLLTTQPSSTSTPVPFDSASSFTQFSARVDRVLQVFAERTKTEKVMRGSGDDSKKEEHAELALGGLDEVFTAKFLTRPGLLDFELSDVSFRRQILIQVLVLLHFLKQFIPLDPSPAAPGKIAKTKMLDFNLDPQTINWVNVTWETIFKEINSTWPSGDKFSKSIDGVLKRETRWSNWKDTACPPFDKPPIPSSDLEETAAKRIRLDQASVPTVQFSVGTPALSELWEDNQLARLDQLENPRPMDDVKSYASRLKREDLLVSNRKRSLEKAGVSEPALKTDDQLQQIEERKASLTFRAVRQATRTSLHLFNKVKPSAETPKPAPVYVSLLIEADKTDKVAKESAGSGGSSSAVPSAVSERPIDALGKEDVEMKDGQTDRVQDGGVESKLPL